MIHKRLKRFQNCINLQHPFRFFKLNLLLFLHRFIYSKKTIFINRTNFEQRNVFQGRRNIRDVLSYNELESETKLAERTESERLKRLDERNILVNILFTKNK